MADYIVRAQAAGSRIRAFAATTAELAERARIIHRTTPVATAAVGRLLTAGAMMGCMLKDENNLLTLQVKGDGPLGILLVTADSQGNVRGYVKNPEASVPPKAPGKLDVGKAVGKGILRVIKDLGLKEPYTGQVELRSGEIADDLTYYFAVSEQIPSAVALGVLTGTDCSVRQAGGFIIQPLPGCEEHVIRTLEETIAGLQGITALLAAGLSPEQILEQILGRFDLEILERTVARYHCNCSRERVEQAVISLGSSEVAAMIAENEPVEVHCHFCNTRYVLSVAELQRLLRDAGQRG
ncbi:MAG TPA: Hsp33 family molecular chaperone HslO [Firmicutes bacterium]|nr:Hsp33 family molecular chaperone HslO [Bacillota bacterium]